VANKLIQLESVNLQINNRINKLQSARLAERITADIEALIETQNRLLYQNVPQEVEQLKKEIIKQTENGLMYVAAIILISYLISCLLS
jgi:hypothetical protein